MKKIDKLIINSPYAEPEHYWEYFRDRREFILQPGRRKASYIVATPNSQSFDDPGIQVEIELVNSIRPRIKKMAGTGLSGSNRNYKKIVATLARPGRKERPAFFLLPVGSY